ncbi:MAG: phospholipase D-like domain-containing protein, partial [Ruminococcus flavefaciens]|nr:phospholipase D-like domain-containing protein [Ruminococcus flavefaciens]
IQRYTMYWKTDSCICDYLNRKFGIQNTTVIKVTRSNDDRRITKVEFSGDRSFMTMIVPLFPKDVLILSNPYIYTDDIKMVIDRKTDSRFVKHISAFQPVRLEDIFRKDRLIEYPRDSFDQYLQFLSQASKHDHVKSIHLTLYRIGSDPAIFYILRDAVQNGIKVHVNIELCASGETINTFWMNEMIQAGIKVTAYAFEEMKVHSKLTLIKFDNGRAICQIGTGNYHSKTTSQYTDLSLLTSNESICKQVENVFSILCEEEIVDFDDDLLVTPYNLREEMIKLIDAEGKKGRNGYIAFKCNSLDDKEIIKHLTAAAENGCEMDLVVRGVCTFIPNQIGENVRIKSIVWNKLEHSRVYCFGNENPVMYLGSLDLVTKKINQRIETLVKIKDPDIMIRIIDYLNAYITNTEDSWLMTSTGLYIKEE